jgi:hypothetical protein
MGYKLKTLAGIVVLAGNVMLGALLAHGDTATSGQAATRPSTQPSTVPHAVDDELSLDDRVAAMVAGAIEDIETNHFGRAAAILDKVEGYGDELSPAARKRLQKARAVLEEKMLSSQRWTGD